MGKPGPAPDLDVFKTLLAALAPPGNRDVTASGFDHGGLEWAIKTGKIQEILVSSIPRPDLSTRPLQMTCEYTVNAKPSKVYAAWIERFDSWFAQAGTLSMVPEPGRPYFFYNRDEWGRHPHYGRFLDVTENQLIEMTWITGNGAAEGTEGAETVLRIEFVPKGAGTEVRLTHAGFISEKSCTAHQENWPLALKLLDEALASTASESD